MDCTNDIAMIVTPKNPDSRWVALDSNDKVISEGINPSEVISEANKISNDYFIMYLPIEGNTYIF